MDALQKILTLLESRTPGGTVCPSEVARALVYPNIHAGPEAWREAMPAVHAAVDRLVADRRIRLSWKRKTLPQRSGPYRIGRG